MVSSTLNRRTFTAGVASLAVAPRLASADGAGTIKIIAPFPAGGSIDAISRLVQPGLQERLGSVVIVENRPGASGSIGATAVAKSKPDGLTWLMAFDTQAVNPFLQPNLPFDTVKDFIAVELIGTAPLVLACHPSRPYKQFSDVIAAAKAAPGKVTYGSIGSGSLGHLAMVLLGKRADAPWTHVPYRGGGPAVNDAIGGHIDLVIGSAALLAPQVGSGLLRPIVQSSSGRISTMPGVPSMAESGFPGLVADDWWGVFAPANTPDPILEKFRSALVESIRDPVVTQRLIEQQQVTISLKGPEYFKQFFAEQMHFWGGIVRENDIKID